MAPKKQELKPKLKKKIILLFLSIILALFTYEFVEKVFRNKNRTNLNIFVKICSISSEICANVSAELFNHLKSPPISIAMPDIPEPTSYALTKNFHINYETVVKKVLEVLNRKDSARNILAKYKKKLHHDQPHKEFLGPF